MPTVTPSSDLDLELGSLVQVEPGTPPPCECRHSGNPGGRCGHTAVARVTVVCAEEGCHSAAGVYLLCRDCLSTWKHRARRDGVRLRVAPL